MPKPSIRQHKVQPQEPTFRIRYVLLVAVVGSLLLLGYPRAKAAWQLHDAATAFANYGLCMAGPTGAEAIKNHPEQFRRLIRRRLVGAGPDERPFERCAVLAGEVSGSAAHAQTHRAQARDFVEYGRLDSEQAVSLQQLRTNKNRLKRRLADAWPFERAGFRHLIRPSGHAKEAPHPVPFPEPGNGTGLSEKSSVFRATWHVGGRLLRASGRERKLRVHESDDDGLSWRRVSVNQPGIDRYAGRCIGEGELDSFSLRADGGMLHVLSLRHDVVRRDVRVETAEPVIAAACDQDTIVLVLGVERRSLLLCKHSAGCMNMNGPNILMPGQLDVARVEGVTVISLSRGGVTRVASSRDNGTSWTPTTVAYDLGSEPHPSGLAPHQLMTVGTNLFLYAGAPSAQPYPVLVSDDTGATWRTPRSSSAEKSDQTLGISRATLR